MYISARGLKDLMSTEDVKLGVEIGCHDGISTEYFLASFPNLSLKGVDPYHEYVDWNGHHLVNRPEAMSILYDRLGTNVDRFELIRKFSNDAVDEFEDNSLDFIFIDGLHVYDQVLLDCSNYYSKVKKGGVFSGHDYHMIAGVKKAVDKFASIVGATISHTSEDVWYWYK